MDKNTYEPKILDSDELVYLSTSVGETDDTEFAMGEIAMNEISSERAVAVATVKLKTWNPNSLHWEAPSHAIYYSDGRVYLYANRIANHRRHGPFNIGKTYTWKIDYSFMDANKTIIHSSSLVLSTLKHNQARDRIDRSKSDTFLKNKLKDIAWVSTTRVIYR